MNACEKTCVYVWRGNRNLQKVQPSAGFGCSGWLKATPVATPDGRRVRNGLGTVSGRSRDGLGTRTLFARFKFRGRRRILARSGTDFVAGASLSQGQVQISWQARHFLTSGTDASQIPLARTRKAAHADFVAGAAFSRGQVQITCQGRHVRRVKYIFRGRGSIFAGSSTYFVAGAAFSQGQVQISWQAQHFRKVRYRFRGRHSIFARSSTDREIDR